MIVALVAIGLVSVGFSTWVGLLGQRGRAAEIEEHATRRRIAAYNSRAVIREYALERMITSNGDADGVTFDPFAGQPDFSPPPDIRPLKGMTVTSAALTGWSGYPMESSTRLAGLNAFSPSWDYPYSKLLDVTAATKTLRFATNSTGHVEQNLDTSSSSYLKTYVRSRCPVLGGDLLVIHRRNLNLSPVVQPKVSGYISVFGRVMHFEPELAETSYTARSARFVAAPGSLNLLAKDLSGADIPPSNLAWTPITFGRVDSATDLTGRLNVIDDSSNGGNSLRQKITASSATIQDTGSLPGKIDSRGYSNPGTGTVTITPCIGVSNPADLPSIVIDSEVSEIIIEGQTGANFTDYAPYRPGFAIVYIEKATSERKLTTIRLRNQDRRRFLLAIKKNEAGADETVNAVSVIVEDTNATSEWNVVILAENTPLNFSASAGVGTIKLVGGIQTDSPLAGPGTGQQLSLELQTDTRGLIKLAPRAAWVETIMPDKVPGSTTDNTW